MAVFEFVTAYSGADPSLDKINPTPMSHTEPYRFCEVLFESVHESEKMNLFGICACTDRDQSIFITKRNSTIKYS